MAQYDYYTVVYNDVKDYYFGNKETYKGLDRDELIEKLNDDCFNEDCVTGNASGSYTFSRYDAEENLCHNTYLLAEACEEFESNPETLLLEPEAADVTIRCYLLPRAIAEFVDGYAEQLGVKD